MNSPKTPKEQILDGAISHLDAAGPPFASYANIADAANLSRQLMRYYFPEPDALMLEVCDTLSEAYRKALSGGLSAYDGPDKLGYILDFYFGLTDPAPEQPKYGCSDAMTAFAAGHENIQTALRRKYALMGQILQLEIKVAYPDLSMRACSELAYVFLCILQGDRKLAGSIGMNPEHSKIARKAVDTLLKNAQSAVSDSAAEFEVWS